MEQGKEVKTMSPENKVYDDKMLKTIEVVKSNFASVRAGRANAGVLDRIMVEYYGGCRVLSRSPDPGDSALGCHPA